MSEWYEPKGDDIEVDQERSEVNIHVTHNDFGNIYAVLTFDQIRALYKEIEQ